jgi:hypothetical protein
MCGATLSSISCMSGEQCTGLAVWLGAFRLGALRRYCGCRHPGLCLTSVRGTAGLVLVYTTFALQSAGGSRNRIFGGIQAATQTVALVVLWAFLAPHYGNSFEVDYLLALGVVFLWDVFAIPTIRMLPVARCAFLPMDARLLFERCGSRSPEAATVLGH